MTFKQLRFFWYSDLYRYEGRADAKAFFRHVLATPGYKYTFIMRLSAFLAAGRPRVIFRPAGIFFNLLLKHYMYKFGMQIAPGTSIGSGFYIGHFGGIVVTPGAVIGRNCNISHGVTIGQANRGKYKGCPRIGSNVYIGPGAKLFGAVTIGDNAAIGANGVVTKDVPAGAVVGGVPARVISDKGSAGYVINTDYE